MVDVGDVEPQGARRGEAGQGVDQRGGVGAAAASDQDGLAGAEDAVAVEGAGHGAAHAGHLGDALLGGQRGDARRCGHGSATILPGMSARSPLSRFTPAARAWFEQSFAAPTAVQEQGWAAVAAGEHTLMCAPTGSGKTLAAFLWSIDRLMSEAPPAQAERCRVLYISPLKALTVDVERNLRAPLRGIALQAERLGVAVPDVAVAVRTG